MNEVFWCNVFGHNWHWNGYLWNGNQVIGWKYICLKCPKIKKDFRQKKFRGITLAKKET